MPRPAGRSGCVSTSGTSNPAAWMQANARWANSGVPAKATLILCGRCSRGSRTQLVPRLLDHLGLDPVALERAQVFDKDLAQEVIHLVLHAHRQESVGIELI